jgi:preprotein translocase subunit SecA
MPDPPEPCRSHHARPSTAILTKPHPRRSYKQGDPFQEYQEEGYELFQDMLAAVRRNTVYSFFQVPLPSVQRLSCLSQSLVSVSPVV